MSDAPNKKQASRPRRAAAAVADSEAPSLSPAPFQSPRKKRSAKTTTAATSKKARRHQDEQPDAANKPAAPLAAESRLRTLRSFTAKTKPQRPQTSTAGRQRSDSMPQQQKQLPKAVTPASAVTRPRQLQFEHKSSSSVSSPSLPVPLLFACGVPTCKCPRICNFQTLTGFEYLKHYGQDVLRHLNERQATEHQGQPLLLLLRAHSSSSLSTDRQQGMRQDSSTVSSPASTTGCRRRGKPSQKGNDKTIGAPSPDSSGTHDTDEVLNGTASTPSSCGSFSSYSFDGAVTPRPDSVIGTKARIGNGNKSMRFLEEPSELLQRQPHVNQRMRGVLVSWLMEVSIEYNCSMAAYHLAISILDKVLDCGPSVGERISLSLNYDSDDSHQDEPDWPDKWFVVHRSEFQALGCACLWIAAKIEDREPPMMEDFYYISDQSVSTITLRNMESRVCKVLEFRLQCLSPLQFFPTFLRAGRECQDAACTYQSSVQHHMVMYLVSLGRLSYGLSRFRPSVLTAAAVYLSRVTLDIADKSNHGDADHGKYWSAALTHYTGYSKDVLKNPVHLLYHYQLKAEELNIAVFHLFTKTKFDCVSIRTAPRLEDLGFETPIPYDLLDVDP